MKEQQAHTAIAAELAAAQAREQALLQQLASAATQTAEQQAVAQSLRDELAVLSARCCIARQSACPPSSANASCWPIRSIDCQQASCNATRAAEDSRCADQGGRYGCLCNRTEDALAWAVAARIWRRQKAQASACNEQAAHLRTNSSRIVLERMCAQ